MMGLDILTKTRLVINVIAVYPLSCCSGFYTCIPHFCCFFGEYELNLLSTDKRQSIPGELVTLGCSFSIQLNNNTPSDVCVQHRGCESRNTRYHLMLEIYRKISLHLFIDRLV